MNFRTRCIMPRLCIYSTPSNNILVYERIVNRLNDKSSFNFVYNVNGTNWKTNDNPVISGNTSNNDIIWIRWSHAINENSSFNYYYNHHRTYFISHRISSRILYIHWFHSHIRNRSVAMILFRGLRSMKFHRVSYEVKLFWWPPFYRLSNLVPLIQYHEHLRPLFATIYIGR